MDKREYLRSQGFTVGERGRFSAEMLAVLAAAPEGTITEAPKAEPKPRPTRVVVAQDVPAPAPLPEVDPKEVRAWAKQNGHEVGERGRIHTSVVKAYLDAGGKGKSLAPSTPVAVLPPVVRKEKSGFSRIKGILIRQDKCGSCGNAVNRCPCTTGPAAHKFLSKEVGSTVVLTLDKPSL
jgi:hypothetical protein